MYKKKIYVCCALTHAPPEDIEVVARLKNLLRQWPGIEILDFLSFPPQVGDKPGDVYRRDILECVEQADALLVIYQGNITSDGRGYEVATMIERRRQPVIAVAHSTSEVTALVTDLAVIHPDLFSLHRYFDLFRDVPLILRYRMRKLWPAVPVMAVA